MGASTFTQRLEQRKKEIEKNSHSDKSRITRWRLALGELSIKIRRWLDEPIKKNLVDVSAYDKTLHEERLGAYKVKGLVVSLGGQRVTFDPVATYVVGAFGRVDMVGPVAKFTLVREKDDEHWSLIDSNDPRRLVPLTKEVFERTLLAALG